MDQFSALSVSGTLLSDSPFEAKLAALHQLICEGMGFQSIGRISVSTFDRETGMLSVYGFSDVLGEALRLYSAPLAEVPSLAELAKSGRVRVIRDISALGPTPRPHALALRQNYRSSLTIPIRKGAAFYGFIFFNSCEADFFGDAIVDRVLPYGQLLAASVIAELDRVTMVKAAVRTTRDIGNLRDDETAGHLHRMSAYARLIALGLASRLSLSERWIDMMTHFAPLHDVGKIGVPDNILFKPGQLTPAEFEIMRSHVAIGVRVVRTLLSNFDIFDQLFSGLLLNIVACHHETLDGTGYPDGIAGDAIPIEARIVAVADVFDALTSERPYKRAWTVDDAFAHLRTLAGAKLDGSCVGALTDCREQVVDIKRQFHNGDNSMEARAA